MKNIGYLNEVQSLLLDKPNLVDLVSEKSWKNYIDEANASLCEGNNIPVLYGSSEEVDMWLNKLPDFNDDIYNIDYSDTVVSNDYEIYEEFYTAKKQGLLKFSKVKTPAFIITNGIEIGFIVTWGYQYPRFKGRIQQSKEKEVLTLLHN